MEEYRGGTDEKVMRIRAGTKKVRREKSQLGGRTEADGKWKVSGLLSRKCSLGYKFLLTAVKWVVATPLNRGCPVCVCTVTYTAPVCPEN